VILKWLGLFDYKQNFVVALLTPCLKKAWENLIHDVYKVFCVFNATHISGWRHTPGTSADVRWCHLLQTPSRSKETENAKLSALRFPREHHRLRKGLIFTTKGRINQRGD